jgi:hypothetical protein
VPAINETLFALVIFLLTDGNFLGYQNNLTLSVLGKLKHIITGGHRATVALRGLGISRCYATNFSLL